MPQCVPFPCGVTARRGFFLVLIGAAAVPTSLYAIGYTAPRHHGLASLTCAYNIFLGAMTLVPLAANMLTFLVAWELMSLAPSRPPAH